MRDARKNWEAAFVGEDRLTNWELFVRVMAVTAVQVEEEFRVEVASSE